MFAMGYYGFYRIAYDLFGHHPERAILAIVLALVVFTLVYNGQRRL